MRKPREIAFLVDENGHRKTVLMSYWTYLALKEDLETIAEREDEKAVDLDTVIAESKAGK